MPTKLFSSDYNPNRKLTTEQVKEIRRLLNQGIRGNELAKQFNTTEATISRIRRNKIWKTIN